MKFLKWNSFSHSVRFMASVGLALMLGVQACHSGNDTSTASKGDEKSPFSVSDNNIQFRRDLSGQYGSETGQNPWLLDIASCPRTGCTFTNTPFPFQPLPDTFYRYGWTPIMQTIPVDQPVTYEFSMWLPENAGVNPNDPSVLTVGMWINEQGYSVLSHRFSQDKSWIEFVSTGAGATVQGGNVTRLSSGYPRGYPVKEQWNTLKLNVVWSKDSKKGMMQWSANDKVLMNYTGKTLADTATTVPLFLLGSMVEGNEAFVQKTSLKGIKFRDVRITTGS